MSWYRKIDTRIQNDEKFSSWTDDGKLAFFILLTHQNLTALGAMRGTIPGLAAEFKWEEQRLRRALQPAIDAGSIEVNEAAAYIGLPNFLQYNEPEGPNSVKAWGDAVDLIPECPEKSKLIIRCRSYLDGKSQKFKDAIGDAIKHGIWNGKAMPCRIQEQEQEQETDTCSKSRILSDGEFSEFWKAYPKKVGKIAAQRAWNKAKARPALSKILDAIAKAKESDAWTKEKGRYIPNPATWLSEGRWDDEVFVPPKPKLRVGGM